MSNVVKFEQEVEGEETLSNTKNWLQVVGFAAILVGAVVTVLWLTNFVSTTAWTILTR